MDVRSQSLMHRRNAKRLQFSLCGSVAGHSKYGI
nr:MAG TPA: hypothetical protein [Caudoviricetes sp.]